MKNNNSRKSLSKTFFSSITFLASLLLCSTFLLSNQSILTQAQFENKQQIDILDYESISNQNLDSATDFDNNGTISTNQFQTGEDDLITTLGSQEGLALNHYGDNPPDPTNLGDWWDDDSDPATVPNWKYRNCFEIDYSAGTTDLEEYQIFLDFDSQTLISASQMQSQGEDIRIVDNNGNVVDHFISGGVNTGATKVWIQPDLITAGSVVNYCLYYGNTGAVSTSNKDSVFTYTKQKSLYYNLSQNSDGGELDFGSLVDNNQVEVDSKVDNFDKFEVNQSPSTTFEPSSVIESKSPLQATINEANRDAVVPLAHAGTDFTYRMDRNTHYLEFVAPLCDADIEIFNTNNLAATVTGGSFTVTEGSFAKWWEDVEGDVGDFGNNQAVYIRSTNNCPFLAYHVASNGNDTFTMIPSSSEDWYGVGSGSLEVSSSQDAGISVYDSGASTATNYTLNSSNNYHVADAGAANSGQAPSQRVVVTSGGPIGAKSIADGNGGESTTFLPRSSMDTKFIISEASSYITMATIAGVTTTIELYNNAADCTFGNTSPSPTQTQVATSTNDFPGFARFVGTFSAGVCIVANHPIAPYFEKTSGNEETNTWSFKQSIPKLLADPTVSIGSEETGTWNLDGGSNWTNRIPVTITNNDALNPMTEHPVRIDLTGQDILTDAQTDGGDVRVGDASGASGGLQDYYLEEFGNSFAGDGDIWTQANVASGGTQIIYVYYNSSGKTSQSNQEAVFTYSNKQAKYYIVNQNLITPAALNIYSYVDDNEFDFLGTKYTDHDRGEDYTDAGVTAAAIGTIAQGEVVTATGPINGVVRGNVTETLSPRAYAGTKFLSTDTSGVDIYSMVSLYGPATVTFERHDGTGWVAFGANVNLVQDVPQNIQRDTNSQGGFTPNNSVRVTSTSPILIHKHANEAGVPNYDSINLYPVEEMFEESNSRYEAYGVSSGNVIIATENPTTNLIITEADGSTTNLTIDNTTSNVGFIGGQDQGLGDGMRISADGPFFANAIEDGDGVDSTAYHPKKEFSDEFLIPTGAQYVSIVSDEANTSCTQYLANGTPNITVANMGINDVNHTVIGNTTVDGPSQFFKGDYIECSNPVYAYYDKNQDDSDTAISDETNFLSYAQARFSVEVEPTVTYLEDSSVIQEGVFHESGFDSAGADTLPKASWEYVFDSADSDVSWESVDIAEGVFDSVAASENSVTPITGTIESASAVDCNAATYTLSISLSSGLNTLPESFIENNCLRVTITLQTGNTMHSPIVDAFDLVYSIPDSIEDYLTDEDIVISATSGTESISLFQLTTDNPELIGSILQISYLGSSNNAAITQFDLSFFDPSTDTEVSQFSWPPFPGLPETSIATVTFDDARDQIVRLDYDRPAGGGPATVDLLIEVLDNASLDPLLSREVTVTINP